MHTSLRPLRLVLLRRQSQKLEIVRSSRGHKGLRPPTLSGQGSRDQQQSAKALSKVVMMLTPIYHRITSSKNASESSVQCQIFFVYNFMRSIVFVRFFLFHKSGTMTVRNGPSFFVSQNVHRSNRLLFLFQELQFTLSNEVRLEVFNRDLKNQHNSLELLSEITHIWLKISESDFDLYLTIVLLPNKAHHAIHRNVTMENKVGRKRADKVILILAGRKKQAFTLNTVKLIA